MDVKANANLELTATISMTEREFRLLSILSNFDGLGKIICEHITKFLPPEDWDKMFSSLRAATNATITRMDEVHKLWREGKTVY